MKPPPQDDTPAVERFVAQLDTSLRDDVFVRLVLSSPNAQAAPVERVIGRLVSLGGTPVLSLTFREAKRDVTRNLPVREAPEWLRQELPGRFHAALLETTNHDWQLQLSAGLPPRLVRHSPRQAATPSRNHDREKPGALGEAGDWLAALGLVDDRGRPFPSRADKHRQIQRYGEILGHLVAECGWARGDSVRLADMGCGRGYLTFATWQLLRRQLGLSATVVGVEERSDLAQASQGIAQRLGLAGLEFVAGTIAASSVGTLDGIVALHACNTATDDAIRRGIEQGCRLIVVAPCCHQEVLPQLGQPEPFAGVLRHGLFAGRLAEWLTDALRALHLEHAGYRVKAVEFVASEHTPKNLLLAGVRGDAVRTCPEARDQILQLKQLFAVRQHALDSLLTR